MQLLLSSCVGFILELMDSETVWVRAPPPTGVVLSPACSSQTPGRSSGIQGTPYELGVCLLFHKVWIFDSFEAYLPCPRGAQGLAGEAVINQMHRKRNNYIMLWISTTCKNILWGVGLPQP